MSGRHRSGPGPATPTGPGRAAPRGAAPAAGRSAQRSGRRRDGPQLLSPARHFRAAPLPELLPGPVARHGGRHLIPLPAARPAAPARSLRLHSPPFPSTGTRQSAAILAPGNNAAPYSTLKVARRFQPTRSESPAGWVRLGQSQSGSVGWGGSSGWSELWRRLRAPVPPWSGGGDVPARPGGRGVGEEAAGSGGARGLGRRL